MAHVLFIYGTLKRGHCRADALAGQTFLGEVTTVAEAYVLLDCGAYPGLVEAKHNAAPVEGELWRVDDDCLARLDAIEGVAEGLFARRAVRLRDLADLTDPLPAEAIPQAYFYTGETTGKRACGGRW